MKALYDSRKSIPFLIVLILVAIPGYGDDGASPWTFSSETGMAFIYGEAKEIVYKSSSGTDFLSLLVYPIPPSLGVYVGMEGRWRDTFLARIRLETAWPLMSGNSTNDDWLNVSSVLYEPDVHSDSTAYLTSWLHGELEFGFPESKLPATVETLLGFTFRQMSWEGWDAFQVSAIPEYSVGEIPGYVIDYRQTWFIPWLGLSLGHQKGDSIFTASFRFSPWMYVVGRDVHMAREDTKPKTFIDVMSGGVMLSGGLAGEIRLTGNLWLTGKATLQYCSGARGDTFIYTVGTPGMTQYLDTGGSVLSMFSSYLGFSVHP